jgi:hypothetical protein
MTGLSKTGSTFRGTTQEIAQNEISNDDASRAAAAFLQNMGGGYNDDYGNAGYGQSSGYGQ